MATRAIEGKGNQREKRTELFAGFDVETDGLDGKLLLAQSYHELWDQAHTYHKIEHFLQYVFEEMDLDILHKTIWFIHNAKYDLRYVFEAMGKWKDKFDWECRERAPGNFYEIIVNHKTLKTPSGKPLRITRFRDSMAVFPHSLKKLTESFAPQFVKQDIGLGRGVRFDRKNPVHIEYAKNDVLGLVAAMIRFDELLFANFRIHVKGTTSSTAYAAWLRTIPKGEFINRQAPAVEAFMRECYNGGLVQINADYGRHYPEATTFDINSSYPASMKLGVPKGRAVWTKNYVPDMPGFYRVTVTVPDDALFPIMPHHGEREQLAWARGTYETKITSIEMDHAIERGCTFKVHSGFYYPKGLDNCFTAFVNICERLRKEFKGTPTETLVKLMQNSLYGRFGMRPDGRECTVSFDGQPLGFIPVIDEDTARAVPNIYWKPVVREAEYMLPHFAAWITANSRILIDKATEAAGREITLYRDTDSVTIIGTTIPPVIAALIGSPYGMLKSEGIKYDVRYHAPKCYTYRDASGTIHAVYKGIPSKMLEPDAEGSAELLETLHRGDGHLIEVKYHSSTNLPTFWRTGKKSISRTRSGTHVDQVYGHVIEAGRFRPRRIFAPPPPPSAGFPFIDASRRLEPVRLRAKRAF